MFPLPAPRFLGRTWDGGWKRIPIIAVSFLGCRKSEEGGERLWNLQVGIRSGMPGEGEVARYMSIRNGGCVARTRLMLISNRLVSIRNLEGVSPAGCGRNGISAACYLLGSYLRGIVGAPLEDRGRRFPCNGTAEFELGGLLRRAWRSAAPWPWANGLRRMLRARRRKRTALKLPQVRLPQNRLPLGMLRHNLRKLHRRRGR